MVKSGLLVILSCVGLALNPQVIEASITGSTNTPKKNEAGASKQRNLTQVEEDGAFNDVTNKTFVLKFKVFDGETVDIFGDSIVVLHKPSGEEVILSADEYELVELSVDPKTQARQFEALIDTETLFGLFSQVYQGDVFDVEFEVGVDELSDFDVDYPVYYLQYSLTKDEPDTPGILIGTPSELSADEEPAGFKSNGGCQMGPASSMNSWSLILVLSLMALICLCRQRREAK